MPIGVRCPECGREYQLQDSLAGTKLRCIDCQTTIPVPGAASGAKICAVCRVDIAAVPRFKDEAGYYYCGGCWKELEAALAALPPDARALRLEIMRQRIADAHRPVIVPRPAQSELVRLVHLVFNSRRTLNEKLTIGGLWLVATVLSFIYPAAAVGTWAALMLLGAFILIFCLIWTFGPPFAESWRTGTDCLLHRYQRTLWQEKNRDYRLRWPVWTPVLGILLVGFSWAYWGLASRHYRAPAEPPSAPATAPADPAGSQPPQ